MQPQPRVIGDPYAAVASRLDTKPSILFVDPGGTDQHVPALRTRFDVVIASSQEQAVRALALSRPLLVITELLLDDGDGVALCRHAKSMNGESPLVLVTTAVPDRVPDALLAGCDAVLLKPYGPSILCTRVGRIVQQHAKALAERAMWQRVRSTHDYGKNAPAGTNTVWHDGYCPSCGRPGIVGFDAASYRRTWYACVGCRHVWMAARRETSY
jgi:CheY-like chemotaxis protein